MNSNGTIELAKQVGEQLYRIETVVIELRDRIASPTADKNPVLTDILLDEGERAFAAALDLLNKLCPEAEVVI